ADRHVQDLCIAGDALRREDAVQMGDLQIAVDLADGDAGAVGDAQLRVVGQPREAQRAVLVCGQRTGDILAVDRQPPRRGSAADAEVALDAVDLNLGTGGAGCLGGHRSHGRHRGRRWRGRRLRRGGWWWWWRWWWRGGCVRRLGRRRGGWLFGRGAAGRLAGGLRRGQLIAV